MVFHPFALGNRTGTKPLAGRPNLSSAHLRSSRKWNPFAENNFI